MYESSAEQKPDNNNNSILKGNSMMCMNEIVAEETS
jgi:hypothetical protein